MRTSLALICSVALACAASAQEASKSKKPTPKKTQAQSTQHAVAPGGGPLLDKPTFGEKFKMFLAGKPTTAGQQIATQRGQTTPSPHGYVGRNDGKVQQSTAYDKPVLNPIIFDPHGVPAAKPTGGKPAESQQSAGGKKKGENVSPTPRPR
jgi:hypothetical protein